MQPKSERRQFPASAVIDQEADLFYLRSFNGQQRGQLLIAACRAAADIEQGRKLSGMTASSPVPWPVSTQQFQKQWAADVRTTAKRD